MRVCLYSTEINLHLSSSETNKGCVILKCNYWYLFVKSNWYYFFNQNIELLLGHIWGVIFLLRVKVKTICFPLPIFLEVLFGSFHFLAAKEERNLLYRENCLLNSSSTSNYSLEYLQPLEIPMRMHLFSILLFGLKYSTPAFINAFEAKF